MVLDKYLRAISGFKGTEDLSSDISLDSSFTSDFVKLKTISSASSCGPHDCAVTSDGAEKLSGNEQWLETIVRHLPLILQPPSPMRNSFSNHRWHWQRCFGAKDSSVLSKVHV